MTDDSHIDPVARDFVNGRRENWMTRSEYTAHLQADYLQAAARFDVLDAEIRRSPMYQPFVEHERSDAYAAKIAAAKALVESVDVNEHG